jgi:hypothetical protein
VEEFFFKAHGDKHTFKAKSTAERSSWVVALEKKIEEAKAMKDEIQGSEGYKKHMESHGLKRLTAIGWSREKSLAALEKFASLDDVEVGVLPEVGVAKHV